MLCEVSQEVKNDSDKALDNKKLTRYLEYLKEYYRLEENNHTLEEKEKASRYIKKLTSFFNKLAGDVRIDFCNITKILFNKYFYPEESNFALEQKASICVEKIKRFFYKSIFCFHSMIDIRSVYMIYGIYRCLRKILFNKYLDDVVKCIMIKKISTQFIELSPEGISKLDNLGAKTRLKLAFAAFINTLLGAYFIVPLFLHFSIVRKDSNKNQFFLFLYVYTLGCTFSFSDTLNQICFIKTRSKIKRKVRKYCEGIFM